MNSEMFGDMAVVVEQETKVEAYEMAYNRFRDMSEEVENPEDFRFSLTDSAQDVNNTLPTLRAMAGYADRGHGTYQENREIALIDERELDDRPIEAEKTEAARFANELTDMYYSGMADAIRGEEPYPEQWF